MGAYFSNHLGVEFEGADSPHGPDDCSYIAQGGLIVRSQAGRFVTFAHLLFGGARAGGPVPSPVPGDMARPSAPGFDYIFAGLPLHNHLAIRPIQADIEYADINFGLNSAPTFF